VGTRARAALTRAARHRAQGATDFPRVPPEVLALQPGVAPDAWPAVRRAQRLSYTAWAFLAQDDGDLEEQRRVLLAAPSVEARLDIVVQVLVLRRVRSRELPGGSEARVRAAGCLGGRRPPTRARRAARVARGLLPARASRPETAASASADSAAA
jgi:hypothetical protein